MKEGGQQAAKEQEQKRDGLRTVTTQVRGAGHTPGAELGATTGLCNICLWCVEVRAAGLGNRNNVSAETGKAEGGS